MNGAWGNQNRAAGLSPAVGPAVGVGARLKHLKQAIWLYLLLLLVLEGALRKWVLPGLSTPLLLVRDPVAIYILFEALRLRLVPPSPVFYLSLLIGVLGILLAVLVGHGNLYVAVYGARPLLLHFPAMFVMARVLDRDDILRMGKFVLLLSLVMTLLIAVQFYSPQTAWVNRSIGGDVGAGFTGALGYYRPPGTFSFTSGVAQFYSLQVAFLLYFWLNPKGVRRTLLLAATLALVIALPLSISRSLLFQSAIAVAFAALAAMMRPSLFGRGASVGLVAVLAVVLVSSFGFFQTAVEVIQARFTMANEAEGGLEGVLGDRYLGGLLAAFTGADRWPFWGLGLGMGTNAGAAMLSGEAVFLIAEGEWQRLVGELGMLLGFLVIGMRLWVTGAAALQSGKALMRGDILPWLLLSNAATVLPQGSWNQPTAMGFSIMAGVLLLASLRNGKPAFMGHYRTAAGRYVATAAGVRKHA